MSRNLLLLALGLSAGGALLALSNRDLAWAGGFGFMADTCLALLIGLRVSSSREIR